MLRWLVRPPIAETAILRGFLLMVDPHNHRVDAVLRIVKRASGEAWVDLQGLSTRHT